jgi:predicted nucleic acid-binding protein
VGSLADKIRQVGRIGLDTSLFIFYLEDHLRYLSLCDEVFDLLEQGGAEAVTSTVSLLEVLVQPLDLGKADLVAEYRSFLTATPHLTLRTLDPTLAERAATLRARYKAVRTADAIQLAAAIEFGARLFLTNDDRLRRVTEIEVIVLERWLQGQPLPQTDGET